jgi:1-acyl-sn-glycerol-3-phosphate acyltransferase
LRLLKTTLAYVSFGFGALLLAVTAVPFVRWRARADPEAAERRVQRVIQRACLAWVRFLGVIDVGRVRCTHPERLNQPGTLVVANHPTRIDAVAVLAFMPQADLLVKDRYFDNPFLRALVRAAGYVVSTGGDGEVEACAERLVRGRSLVIFPEGTRSPAEGLERFRRGAAHVALRAGCDVLPVTLHCSPPVLKRGMHWWYLPPFELTLEVGEPIRVKDVVQAAGGSGTRGRSARALTALMRETFENGIERGMQGG